MGIAAAGAGVLYFVVQFVAILLLSASVGSASSGQFLGFATIGLLSGAGTVAGVVAPLGFVAGVVAWRSVPPSVPFIGAVNGFLATMLVYVGPAVVGTCGAVVLAVLTGDAITEAVVGVAAFTSVAFVATCWITLPLGILAGTLYERSRSPVE
ncbi:hypothetical protein [Salinirubrum litoreum]|uniref:Uncharacterized protein n=1 Tax=Salinirubrum litoreum TaxID=1126234 RepID=A0ABD5R878_9EURY|nr:hypothetical protein [Salinirubrum litoreum]